MSMGIGDEKHSKIRGVAIFIAKTAS